MMSDKLVAALKTCADLLKTPRGVYVLHHACMFALYIHEDLKVVERGLFPFYLAELIGQPERVRSVRAQPEQKGPLSSEMCEQHIEWILREVRSMEGFNKYCRWVGFAAGAAARSGLIAKYERKDLFDVLDLPRLIKDAQASESVSHSHQVAHLALGYMQGWLWADGQGSIDDFRRMNMPDDEPFKIEART